LCRPAASRQTVAEAIGRAIGRRIGLRSAAACALGAGLIGCTLGPGAAPKSGAAKRPARSYTIEQFMDTTRIWGASFSADETRLLVSSDQTGIFNAYTVAVGGGPLEPVTRSTTESTYGVSFFPKDHRVLYTRDAGGDENNHLYAVGPDQVERDLTPGAKLKARFVKWSRDDAAFYVLTNERDARFFDLYRYDAASYERQLIYQDDVGYEVGDVSEDGQWLALGKPNTTSDSDIYLYHLPTRALQHITPHEGTATHEVAAFDPGSRWLYYLTNDGAEFTRVRRHELASGRVEEVERAAWDIVYTGFSWHGKYRFTGINADGRTVIRLVEAQTGREVPLPELPEGEISMVEIARSEDLMAFYVNGDRSPNNLYVLDFRTQGVRKLTETLSPSIDAADLVAAQVVRFKSFDGLAVPNIFYRPHQATPQRRVPALVWVHGGPGGQTRHGYSPLIQYLVNHGYVVLGINNRGSTGYGKTFFMADDQKHGREPLWDCVEAKKYLASLPYVDPDRIGIIGGSYGGYMVLAALAFQPEVFDVGVDIFGVSNWVRTLESMPPYWESFRRALYREIGDPVTQREMLVAASPLFHADKIRRPLLVLQGANDPRVIKPESDDIVAAVKRNGIPVEYIVFDDEGHGFSKKKNQIVGYRAILEFLERHLASR